MMTSYKKNSLIFSPYSLIIWLCIFIPGHMGGFIIEQLFIAFVLVWGALIFLTQKTNSNYFKFTRFKILIFFLLLEIFYIISYLNAEITLLGGSGGIRDYLELARYFIYFIFVLIIFFYHPRNSKYLVDTLITASLFYSSFIALIYIFEVPILNNFFEDFIYVATRDDLSQISTGGRVRFAAPFPNSNYLAYFLCMSLVYLLFFTSSARKFLLIIICLFLLFLTGSRTGWLSSGFIFFIYQISYLQLGLTRRGNFGSLILVFTLSSGLIFLLVGGILPAVTRATELTDVISSGDLSSVQSFAHRLEHNLFIWNSVKESLIFGIGPSKYSLTTVIDNQYLLWITRQGIIGFLLIFAAACFIFQKMFRAARTTLHAYGVLCFFGLLALFCMTGAFLNNFRLFLLTIFFVAVILDSCISITNSLTNKMR